MFPSVYSSTAPAAAQLRIADRSGPGKTKSTAGVGSQCFMYRFRLVLNDGAAGAGIRTGTAVQASTSIDDIVVIALRDGTSGASVRASAAAQTCRSDLVGHGKHLHKNLFPYSSILCEKSKNFPIDFKRKFREIFVKSLFMDCLHKGQRKSNNLGLTFDDSVVYWRQTKGQG